MDDGRASHVMGVVARVRAHIGGVVDRDLVRFWTNPCGHPRSFRRRDEINLHRLTSGTFHQSSYRLHASTRAGQHRLIANSLVHWICSRSGLLKINVYRNSNAGRAPVQAVVDVLAFGRRP